jgi:hypothetical protein
MKQGTNTIPKKGYFFDEEGMRYIATYHITKNCDSWAIE